MDHLPCQCQIPIKNIFGHKIFIWEAIFKMFAAYITTNEPPRDKTNKVTVRPAKTQISLGILPV